MKTAIVFYSFSGNTQRAAEFLRKRIGGETKLLRVKPQQETTSFLQQGFIAAARKKIELESIECDLKDYDFVVFAAPVWAFTVAPALRSYLDAAVGLEGKKTACFLTCGSDNLSASALKEVEELLRAKNAHILFSRNLVDRMTEKEDYLDEKFKPLLDMIASSAGK